VSGLEEEYPGRVKAFNVDATTPASKRLIAELGFQTHGLVIRSPDGKILSKQADHLVDMDEARALLRELTEP